MSAAEHLDLFASLPKAELHLHIEGTLEPQMLLDLAEKHGVSLPYQTLEAVERAYNFDNLQSFLDLYYLGAGVLREAEDFYELMKAYLMRCRAQNIVHTEMMFDPQTHLARGIPFEVFMEGFLAAIDEAQKTWQQSSRLLMCFLRDQSEADAFATLELAKPYLQHIEAVGLDSAEVGHPPRKFVRVFQAAADLGLKRIAHAGEEGGPDYILEALDLLEVSRIDHGVQAARDDQLLTRLAESRVPLTVCPLSNVKLKVFNELVEHPLFELLSRGLCVTVNSDDPAYFGGYLDENYSQLIQCFRPSEAQIKQLLRNSFEASFLSDDEKSRWISQLT
ncbi:MAG: adenosine deaminase [Pseudomonadales bacterium]